MNFIIKRPVGGWKEKNLCIADGKAVPRARQSRKPITVYKLGYTTGDALNKFEPIVKTNFWHAQYTQYELTPTVRLSPTCECVSNGTEGKLEFTVGNGYYAYRSLATAKRVMDKIVSQHVIKEDITQMRDFAPQRKRYLTLGKFIIPADAQYYNGNNDDIISGSIIYVKPLGMVYYAYDTMKLTEFYNE